MTTTQQKQKVTFPCCNLLAFGVRVAVRELETGLVWNVARCPKCGRELRLSRREARPETVSDCTITHGDH